MEDKKRDATNDYRGDDDCFACKSVFNKVALGGMQWIAVRKRRVSGWRFHDGHVRGDSRNCWAIGRKHAI